MATNSPAKSTRGSRGPPSSVGAEGPRPASSNKLADSTRSALQAKLAAARPPAPGPMIIQGRLLAERKPLTSNAAWGGQLPPFGSGAAGVAPDAKTLESIAQALHSRSVAAAALQLATAVAAKPAPVSTTTTATTAKQNGEAYVPAGASNAAQKNGAEKADSSSESSSDSSSSGEERDEKEEEKKKEPSPPVTPPMPPRKKRGRPRKYPLSAPAPVSKRLAALASSASSLTPGPTKRATKPSVRLQMSAAEDESDITVLDVGEKKAGSRRRGRGCGHCPGCLRGDCGKCAYCKDKPKFGGPGRKKQRCVLRVCSNFHPAAGAKNVKHSFGDNPTTPPQTTHPQTTPPQTKPPEVKPERRSVVVGVSPTVKATVVEVPSSATPPLTTSTKLSDTISAAVSSTITGLRRRKPADLAEAKMKCVECGRERKQSVARSGKFCTQRCLVQWVERHPDRTLQDALGDSDLQPSPITTTPPIPALEEADVGAKKTRELKNLQIDMAFPGMTLPQPSPEPTSPPLTNPLSPPVLAPSPKPLSSTPAITTKKAGPVPPAKKPASVPAAEVVRKTAATAVARRSVPIPMKKPVSSEPFSVSTKRSAPSPPLQPPALKKSRPSAAPPSMPPLLAGLAGSKSVSFDLSTTTIPASSVVSMPPLLSRSIAPTISIVPLDQLTSLLNTTSKAKQSAATAAEAPPSSTTRIPDSLPSDVRSWSTEQVVAYFRSTVDCSNYADILSEQEVDGTALLLLTHESLVKCLGLKLGRALKIMLHVNELRKEYEQ